jgi:mono/diheme cytochrome c family protein
MRVFVMCVGVWVGVTLGSLDSAAAKPSREASQVAEGAALADKVCSNCHVVSATPTAPPVLAPPAISFMDIAQRPSVNVSYIKMMISSPHWNQREIGFQMPDLRLLDSQKTALAAYILSLRVQRSDP